jgi:DNA-binding MarR family transcriptional regulator
VIDRLEKHTFVRRDRDDSDRRKVHLRSSDRGALLAVQFSGGLRSVFDDVTAQFSDDELTCVHRFMTLASEAMARYRAEPRTAT